MPPSSQRVPRRVAVTGDSGYLGGRLAARLHAHGCEVIGLGRRPVASPCVAHRQLSLGEDVAAEALRDVDALVHCAWDFRPRTWTDIETVNVKGSQKLFAAAAEAGVERLVHISTVSATGAPRSMYGRAKRLTETMAEARGGLVVRPGLLYGPDAGGMVGMLGKLVRALPLVPVLVGAGRPLHLVHEDDLTSLIERAVAGEEGEVGRPLIGAAPDSHSMREVLGAIAEAAGRRRLFVRAPWQLAYLTLRALELAHLPSPMRSDSALSIATLDPDPFREGTRPRTVELRTFDPASLRPETTAVAP